MEFSDVLSNSGHNNDDAITVGEEKMVSYLTFFKSIPLNLGLEKNPYEAGGL